MDWLKLHNVLVSSSQFSQSTAEFSGSFVKHTPVETENLGILSAHRIAMSDGRTRWNLHNRCLEPDVESDSSRIPISLYFITSYSRGSPSKFSHRHFSSLQCYTVTPFITEPLHVTISRTVLSITLNSTID